TRMKGGVWHNDTPAARAFPASHVDSQTGQALQERSVEERQHAPRVGARAIVETVRVRALGQLPELGSSAARVGAVELTLESDGPDEEEGPRARDLVHELHQRPWLRLAGGELTFGAGDG